MLKTLLELLRPLIAQGRTRFLIALIGIVGEVVICYYTDDAIVGKISVAAIAVAFIVGKTIHDIKRENDGT